MEYSVYELCLTLPLFLTVTHAHMLTRTHTRTHTHRQPLKFLLFRPDLCITLFLSSDGTTSKGPFPFELALFRREFDRTREEEEEPCLAILGVYRLSSNFSN